MIFWAEASQQIGMGHMMESLALAELLQKDNIQFRFIINPYLSAEKLLFSRKILFDVIPAKETEKVCRAIKEKSRFRCVIINHRNIALTALEALKDDKFKIAMVDQLGNKAVICDLLVNSAIVPEWLKYNFLGKVPKRCFGPDFAILKDEFLRFHNRKKFFSHGKKTILVSMGGVDRSGATLRVIQALKLLNSAVNKQIILGSGFVHMRELKLVFKKIKSPHFTFAARVNDLAKRLQKADIAVSAGGNTLYEMACVGTPGLVLWEDPHEDIQARAFSDAGTVLYAGNGIKTPILKIYDSLNLLLDNPVKRVQMSVKGKKLIDGHGARRVIKNIIELAGR